MVYGSKNEANENKEDYTRIREALCKTHNYEAIIYIYYEINKVRHPCTIISFLQQ